MLGTGEALILATAAVPIKPAQQRTVFCAIWRSYRRLH